MTFEKFMKECDKITQDIFCVSLNDLSDASWHDYYRDKLSPRDAVEEAFYDYWSEDIGDGLWDYFNKRFTTYASSQEQGAQAPYRPTVCAVAYETVRSKR